jgi:hypothetical protein
MKTTKAMPAAPSRLPWRLVVLGLVAIGSVGLWSIFRSLTMPDSVAAAALPSSGKRQDGLVPWTPSAVITPVPKYGPDHPMYEGPPRDAKNQVNANAVIAAQVEQSLRAEPASKALSSLGLQVMRDSSGNIAGLSGHGPYEWSRAGVAYSDLITAVDGVPVSRLLAVPSAVVRLASQKSAKLTVLRNGQRTSITVGDAAMTPAERIRQVRQRQQERQLYGR